MGKVQLREMQRLDLEGPTADTSSEHDRLYQRFRNFVHLQLGTLPGRAWSCCLFVQWEIDKG